MDVTNKLLMTFPKFALKIEKCDNSFKIRNKKKDYINPTQMASAMSKE